MCMYTIYVCFKIEGLKVEKEAIFHSKWPQAIYYLQPSKTVLAFEDEYLDIQAGIAE